eukprot:22648_1
MDAFSNPRVIMLLSPIFISLFIHTGYAKPKKEDKKKMTDLFETKPGEIYLSLYVEKVFGFIKAFVVFIALYITYDAYVNDKRVITISHIIGVVLYIFSYIIRHFVIKLMKHQYAFGPSIGPEHKLITTGPYNYVRHPAYLSGLIRLIGYIMMYDYNIWVIISWSFIQFCTLQSIKFEERALRKQFGEKHKLYCERVKHKVVPYFW